MAVNLRDAVSVFTRISDIDRELLSKLEIYCKNYFNASALFVRFTVSVWTLGHVVPVHTNKLFDKYNTGLGLNTIKGGRPSTSAWGLTVKIQRLRTGGNKSLGTNT